jgi:hypothetical protein
MTFGDIDLKVTADSQTGEKGKVGECPESANIDYWGGKCDYWRVLGKCDFEKKSEGFAYVFRRSEGFAPPDHGDR